MHEPLSQVPWLFVILLCCFSFTSASDKSGCEVALWRQPNASLVDPRWGPVCDEGPFHCCHEECPTVKTCLEALSNQPQHPKVVVVQLPFYLVLDQVRSSFFLNVRDLWAYEQTSPNSSPVLARNTTTAPSQRSRLRALLSSSRQPESPPPRLPIFLLSVLGNLFCSFPLKWWPLDRTMSIFYDYRLPAPACYVGPRTPLGNATILPLHERPYLFNFVASITTSPVRAKVHNLVVSWLSQHPAWESKSVVSTTGLGGYRYTRTLTQSVFTIVVEGKRPDTHRFWEALQAGSIPIIARYPNYKVPSLHPTTTCRAHAPGVVAQDAPYIVLPSWDRLPGFLSGNLSMWTEPATASVLQNASIASGPRLLRGCITDTVPYLRRWLYAAENWGPANVTRPAPQYMRWGKGRWTVAGWK